MLVFSIKNISRSDDFRAFSGYVTQKGHFFFVGLVESVQYDEYSLGVFHPRIEQRDIGKTPVFLKVNSTIPVFLVRGFA